LGLLFGSPVGNTHGNFQGFEFFGPTHGPFAKGDGQCTWLPQKDKPTPAIGLTTR
jgi:hypothetical protein